MTTTQTFPANATFEITYFTDDQCSPLAAYQRANSWGALSSGVFDMCVLSDPLDVAQSQRVTLANATYIVTYTYFKSANCEPGFGGL